MINDHHQSSKRKRSRWHRGGSSWNGGTNKQFLEKEIPISSSTVLDCFGPLGLPALALPCIQLIECCSFSINTGSVKLATKLAAPQLISAFLSPATAVILYLISSAVNAEQLALLHIYRAPDGNNCSATAKLFEHFRRRRKS